MAIIGWIFFSIFVGVLASKNGRFGFGYFILCCIISPLIGLIIVLVLGENKALKENKKSYTPEIDWDAPIQGMEGNSIKRDIPLIDNDTKICPFCAETIKKAAIVCRYCKSDLKTNSLQKANKDINTSVET